MNFHEVILYEVGYNFVVHARCKIILYTTEVVYSYIAILLKGHLSCIRIVDNQIVDFMHDSYMYTYTLDLSCTKV